MSILLQKSFMAKFTTHSAMQRCTGMRLNMATTTTQTVKTP